MSQDKKSRSNNISLMANGNGTKINVAKLQILVELLQKDVSDIKNNHLEHIYDRIGSLERKIAYWAGGVGVGLAILQILLRK